MGSNRTNMKLLGQTVLALAIFGFIKAQNQDNCHTYAAGACRDTSDHWSAQGSSCNAVYGNIAGNKHNLGKLMADNLKQSFQFIAMSSYFKSDIVNPFDINGEVKALASTLTTLKSNAEDIFTVHKHANNKHDHPDDPNLNSYDPSVIRFLEGELIEDYQSDIRLMSGQLNVLGKMAKHQNSRNMGLHLFDKNLQ